MDASYKIQRGIHVHLIQFFMCPEFWVHIILCSSDCFFCIIAQNRQCIHKSVDISVKRVILRFCHCICSLFTI